jgi:uncharacterized protein YozE (UPF0346 family)
MAALVTFYEWLGKQKGLRTPVGELARAALRDKDFPRDVATLDAFLEYVKKSSPGSAEPVAIARAAYRAYERSAKPASRV